MSTEAGDGARALRRIGVVVYDGVDEIDCMTVYGVLRKARQYRPSAPGIDAVLLGPPRTVITAQGAAVAPAEPYGSISRCDGIVIPGGSGVSDLSGNEECRAQTLAFIAARRKVYSICSGAVFLARIGALDGIAVAIHHRKIAQLGEPAGCTPARGLTRCGWLTSIGGEATGPYLKGIEIAYQILRDFDPETVDYVADRLEYRPHYTAAVSR